MADTPNQGPDQQSNPGDDAAGGASQSVTDHQAKLNQLLEDNQKLQQRYEELQRLNGQHTGELGQLRKFKQAVEQQIYPGDYSGGGQSGQTPIGGDDFAAQKAANNDRILSQLLFRSEHPDWKEHESTMNEILQDNYALTQDASFFPDGSVDWGRTYTNVYKTAKLKAIEAAKKKAQMAQQEADSTIGETGKEAAILDATLSGTTAGRPAAQPLTAEMLRGKSSKEIAEIARQYGLVDESDLPSSLR